MKKRLLIFTLVILIIMLAACGGTEENAVESQETNAAVSNETGPAAEVQTDEMPQNTEEGDDEEADAVDEQKVKVYLGILGLDDNADYTVLDQFPIEGSDEKSILMDINGIDQEQFDTIIQYMKDCGCYLVSDPMVDEEKHTTALQYRNADDTLYIEMVYSADAYYINIIFTPININGEE